MNETMGTPSKKEFSFQKYFETYKKWKATEMDKEGGLLIEDMFDARAFKDGDVQCRVGIKLVDKGDLLKILYEASFDCYEGANLIKSNFRTSAQIECSKYPNSKNRFSLFLGYKSVNQNFYIYCQ